MDWQKIAFAIILTAYKAGVDINLPSNMDLLEHLLTDEEYQALEDSLQEDYPAFTEIFGESV